MANANLSQEVLDAFTDSDWDISDGVSEIGNGMYIANFYPVINANVQQSLEDNNINISQGLVFDGTDTGILEALRERQEDINTLTEDNGMENSFNFEEEYDDTESMGGHSGIDSGVFEFNENLQYLIDSIDEIADGNNIVLETQDLSESKISQDEIAHIDIDSKGVIIQGYDDITWHTMDFAEIDGEQYFLMEAEVNPENYFCIVLNENGDSIVHNIDTISFDNEVQDAVRMYNGESIDFDNLSSESKLKYSTDKELDISSDSEIIEDDEELIINNKSEDIEINGYEGTWKTIDSIEENGKRYFLMENEQAPEDNFNIILDGQGYLIVSGVSNGFDDEVLDAIDGYDGYHIDLNVPVIDENSEDIVIDGYQNDGTWHVIDSAEIDGEQYFLMENDASQNNDYYNIVLNADGDIIAENVNTDGQFTDDILEALRTYDGESIDMLNLEQNIEIAEEPDKNTSELDEVNKEEFSYNPHQMDFFEIMHNQDIAADEMPNQGLKPSVSNEVLDAIESAGWQNNGIEYTENGKFTAHLSCKDSFGEEDSTFIFDGTDQGLENAIHDKNKEVISDEFIQKEVSSSDVKSKDVIQQSEDLGYSLAYLDCAISSAMDLNKIRSEQTEHSTERIGNKEIQKSTSTIESAELTI